MESLRPVSVQRAFDNLLNKMYINNVANRLRELNEPKESDKKRWIWELIQNAKDSIAHDPSKATVDIEIIIENDRFIFKHNGSPFTADAQLGLLYKYSEGKRGDSESSGRFGTGFMTTHTLSKIVDIESNLIDDDGKLYGFRATMYREGYQDPELLAGIERTSKSITYFESASEWTTLTYHLKNENNFSALKLGLESFEQNVLPTLSFCKEVRSIKVVNNGAAKVFNRLAANREGPFTVQNFSVEEGGAMRMASVATLSISEPNEELSQRFKTERNLRLSLAVSIDKEKKEILFNEKSPSLFCVFPLIGSEKFRFPCLINSPDFEPHNEREKLLLSGKEIDEENGVVSESGINKMIFLRSIRLYELMLQHFTSTTNEQIWKSLHLFAIGVGKAPHQEDFFDAKWYEENVLAELRKRLLLHPVVETNHGLKPINAKGQEIFFPRRRTATKEVRDQVWVFTNQIYPNRVPKLDIVDEWDKLIWEDCNSQTLESLCEQISLYQTLSALPIVENKAQWLDSFLTFVVSTDKVLLEKYALIPNQNLKFCFYNLEGFSEDDNLPDCSHEILRIFNIEWRSILRLSGINVALPSKKSKIDLADQVNRELQKAIKENNENLLAQVLRLTSFMPILVDGIDQQFIDKRRSLWRYAHSIYKNSVPDSVEKDGLPSTLWKEADDWLLLHLVQVIANQKEVSKIEVQLAEEQTKLQWLDEFIGFVIAQGLTGKLSEEGCFIIPNQKEIFCAKRNLLKDDQIPEELKVDKFEVFGLKLKDRLLHNNIKCYQPEGSPYTIGLFVTEFNELFKKEETPGKDAVVQELISLFPKAESMLFDKRQKVWQFCRDLFGDLINAEPKELTNYNEELWRNADDYAISVLINKLISLQPKNTEENGLISSLAQLAALLFAPSSNKDEVDAAIWVNSLLNFLSTYQVPFENLCIIPNQSGNFREFHSLYRDEVHDQLKNILCLLDSGLDMRTHLIHPAITLQPKEEINFSQMGAKIRELVQNGFNRSKTEYTDNYKEAIKLLVVDWFTNPKYPQVLYNRFISKDAVNKEFFGWAFDHRYELENLVLSTVEERKLMYEREKEIKEGKKIVIDAEEYEKLLKNQTFHQSDNTPSGSSSTSNAPSNAYELEPLSQAENDHLTEIELLLGDRITKKDMADYNYQAKLLSMKYLKDQGFDLDKAEDKWEDGFSFIDGIEKGGQIFKVIAKSADKGTLYVNPTEWINLSADNCFMIVFFKKNSIKIYESPSSILSQNSSTICRVDHAKVGEEQIDKLAVQNNFVKTFKFIFFTEANTFTDSDSLKAKEHPGFAVDAEVLSENYLDD